MASSNGFNHGITVLKILMSTILCLKLAIVSGHREPFMRQCPEACNCTSKIFPKFVNCSKRELSDVPKIMYLKFYKICLAFNDIESISDTDFKNLCSVNWLNLKNNKIYMINPEAFRSMTKLVHLDLSFNQLINLPDKLFENNLKLKYLNLAGNYFQNFDFVSSSLVVLYMNNCQIEQIVYSFFWLPNLKKIILDNNPITTISTDVIRAIPELKELYVMNQEHCLPQSFQELTTYLRENKIYYAPMSICNQETYGELFWKNKTEHTDLHTPIVRPLIITLICLCGLLFSGVFCFIIVYECFNMKRKVRNINDSESHVPTAPPSTPTEVKENMPWYKNMLQLLFFGLPCDQKEISTSGNCLVSKKSDPRTETTENGNNRY